MVTKHFFKVLCSFLLLIALGMAGILYVNSREDQKLMNANSKTAADCAKADC